MAEKAACPGVSAEVHLDKFNCAFKIQTQGLNKVSAVQRTPAHIDPPINPPFNNPLTQERDGAVLALWNFNRERANVLCDAAVLLVDDVAIPQRVKQRRLSVVHVTHDRDWNSRVPR